MEKNLNVFFKQFGKRYFLGQRLKDLPFKDFSYFSSHYYLGFHAVQHPHRQRLGLLKHCQLDKFAPNYSLPPFKLCKASLMLIPLSGALYIFNEQSEELVINSKSHQTAIVEAPSESYFRSGNALEHSHLSVLSVFVDGLSSGKSVFQSENLDGFEYNLSGTEERSETHLRCKIISLEHKQTYSLEQFGNQLLFAVVLKGSVNLGERKFAGLDSFEMIGEIPNKTILANEESRLLLTFQDRF